eukprot:c27670_g1_i1.p1 GENE.c27670_g1_i1~~c27670_g1_i1.p1  ORF type:complete len:112 (-),score=47.19 c27670_g1_i1:110-424(-)
MSENKVFTLQELSQFNGQDASKPILVCLEGIVFDVTPGKSFYGPGGSYSLLAGSDATRALGKMSLSAADVNGNTDDLTTEEWTVVRDWIAKFKNKYQIVGTLQK